MAVPFRVAIVPGVTPTKWVRTWRERRTDRPIEVLPVAEDDVRDALDEGLVDVAFVRLPIDEDGLSVIRLYEEPEVVVVPKEHPIAVFDAVTLADLEGENARTEPAPDAVAIVAAGVGIARMPFPVARLHSHGDVVAVPITDAPTTRIALVWNADATTDDIDEFIGIVRGRTARSSRGSSVAGGEPKPPAPAPAAAQRSRRPARARTAKPHSGRNRGRSGRR